MPPAPQNTRGRARLKPRAKPKAKHKPGRPPPRQPAATPEDQPLTAPLNARSLAEQVAAQAGLAYGGAEQALQGEVNVSAQVARNIPAWYQQYRDALAQATQATQGAYVGALGAQQTMAASSSALDAQQRAQMLAGMQTDAASRGAQVDPAIAAQGQQAAASRRAMLDSYAGLTAQQGAAQVAYGANRQVVGAGQQIQAQEGEAQRGRNLAAKGVELAREKGQYAATARQKLIDSEHQKELERKAFGLKVEEAAADVSTDQARVAETRRRRIQSGRSARAGRSLAERRQTETERANRERERTARDRLSAGGRAGETLAARRQRQKDAAKVRNAVNTAASDARTLRGSQIPVEDAEGKPTGKNRKLTETEIRSAVRKRYKDRDVANAAMDLAILGYVSPENERRLRARGIGVPREWLTRRPRARPAIVDVAAGRPNMSPRPPAG